MPLTTTASVAFCRDLELGRARLHDVEGFAEVEGTPDDWKITGFRLACITNPLGTTVKDRWGYGDLGDDPLSRAVGAQLEKALVADPHWCDLAEEALRIGLDLEREQAAYDRHQFNHAAE